MTRTEWHQTSADVLKDLTEHRKSLMRLQRMLNTVKQPPYPSTVDPNLNDKLFKLVVGAKAVSGIEVVKRLTEWVDLCRITIEGFAEVFDQFPNNGELEVAGMSLLHRIADE